MCATLQTHYTRPNVYTCSTPSLDRARLIHFMHCCCSLQLLAMTAGGWVVVRAIFSVYKHSTVLQYTITIRFFFVSIHVYEMYSNNGVK